MNRIQFVVVILVAMSGCGHQASEDLPKLPLLDWPVRKVDGAPSWFQADDLRYGLHDAGGDELLPPTYDDVRSFSEGHAAVNQGAKWVFPGVPDGGKWGYVNDVGELTIPLQFQYANDFSDGLACVSNWSTGEGTMFIDRDGEVQIRIPDGNAGDFREGLAPVHRDRSLQNEGWLTEYIDKSGDVQFEVRGYGEEFYEGLAVLSLRSGNLERRLHGYIDQQGSVVMDHIFADAKQFSEGLASVRVAAIKGSEPEELWGYIDRNGTSIIKPIYNEAFPFYQGKAVVHQGGRLLMMEDAPCEWEGGNWWLIDRTGKKLARIRH
ncbi:MAG: WG repeat-containing protein [Rubripirellula sp.]